MYTAVFSNDKTIHYAPEKLKQFPDLAKEFMGESDQEGIVHVYDMSGSGCELYNDLEQERLIVRI